MTRTRVLGFAVLGIAASAAVLMTFFFVQVRKPSDAARKLTELYAQRSTVPAEDNAYVYAWGFNAPLGTDPMELGQARISWLLRKVRDPSDLSPDPMPEAEDRQSRQSPNMRSLADTCRQSARTPCALAFERWPMELALSEREILELERYKTLLARRGWFESVPLDADTTLPPYASLLDGQRLRLLQLRRDAELGDTEAVRDALQQDLTFWRGVLSTSDVLISKMIAISGIRQHFFFGNLVLRRLPSAGVENAIPAAWLVELTAAERSLLRVSAGEYVYIQGMVRAAKDRARATRAELEENDLEDAPDILFDRAFGAIGDLINPPQHKLNQVADVYLSFAQALAVPLNRYPQAIARLREAGDLGIKEFKLDVYAYRVGSVEGMRRAALLTAQLRGKAVDAAQVPAELKAAPLRDPFTHTPFGWDPVQRAVIYEGPENHRWKRNSFTY